MARITTGTIVTIMVTLAVIVPLGTGYLMPDEVEYDTSYTFENSTNITEKFQTVTVPNSYIYNSYLNNLFQFSYYGAILSDGDETLTPTNYPKFIESVLSQTQAAGTSTVIDLTTRYAQAVDPYAIYLNIGLGSITYGYLYAESTEYVGIIYFPGTGLVYGMTASGTMSLLDTTTVEVVGVTEDTAWNETIYQQKKENGKSVYLDPTQGFGMRWRPITWTNAQENEMVAFTIENANLSWSGETPRTQYIQWTPEQRLNITKDGYYITATWNGTTKQIGFNAVYDKILVVFDAKADAVSVSGLLDMPTYSESPIPYIANTVTFENADLDNVDYAVLGGNTNYRYYVPYARVLSTTSTVQMMQDVGVIAYPFYPGKDMAISLLAPNTYGNRVMIGALSTVPGYGNYGVTFDLAVENSVVKNVPFISGARDVPIEKFTLWLVTDGSLFDTTGSCQMMVNGELLANSTVTWDEYTGPIAPGIFLYGLWNVTVTASEVTTFQTPIYSWGLNGFALDLQTYLMVGAVASFGLTIAVGLWFIRNEDRYKGGALVPLMVGIACTVFYVWMLFA